MPGFGRKSADWGWIALFAALAGALLWRNLVLDRPHIGVLDLGPIEISPFGLFVALDILFGYYLVRRWCLRFGLDWDGLADGMVWIVVLGLYLSHLVSVAAYYPEDLLDWRVLLDVRTRISSFGGMFGGGLVAAWWLRRRSLDFRTYADGLVYGFVGGYIFGRAGCFSVHDHPGRPTELPWGVSIDGVSRHDLGLYEMFLMIGLFLLINRLSRDARPRSGMVLGLTATLYAPVRFAFDSLRIADVRYAGLTPGQWFAIPLLLVGLWALRTAGAGESRRSAGR